MLLIEILLVIFSTRILSSTAQVLTPSVSTLIDFQTDQVVMCDTSCPPLSDLGFTPGSKIRNIKKRVTFLAEFAQVPSVGVFIMAYSENIETTKGQIIVEVDSQFPITTTQFQIKAFQEGYHQLSKLTIGWVATTNPQIKVQPQNVSNLLTNSSNEINFGITYSDPPYVFGLIQSFNDSFINISLGNITTTSYVVYNHGGLDNQVGLCTIITDKTSKQNTIGIEFGNFNFYGNQNPENIITFSSNILKYITSNKTNNILIGFTSINYFHAFSSINFSVSKELSDPFNKIQTFKLKSWGHFSLQYVSFSLIQCLSQAYLVDGFCEGQNSYSYFIACPSNCKQCVDEGYCIECEESKNLLGVCKCYDQYYQDSLTQKCKSNTVIFLFCSFIVCPSECINCESEFFCTSCQKNRFLHAGECICSKTYHEVNKTCVGIQKILLFFQNNFHLA